MDSRDVRRFGVAAVSRAGPTHLEVWLAVLTATTGLGLLAIVAAFSQGHEKMFNASRWVPWGILISTYVFLVVSSTGMCLIASFGHVFGIKRFEPLGRRAIFLAIITLLVGFIVISAELERPWRLLIWAVLSPNVASPIWWMGTLYTFYLFFLLAEFFFLRRVERLEAAQASSEPGATHSALLAVATPDILERQLRNNMKFARLAGVCGVLSAISAHSVLGAVFGLTETRPLWYGPYTPIYFILSALVSGTALLSLGIVLTYELTARQSSQRVQTLILDLGKLLLLFLGIYIFFTVWKVISGLYGYVPGKYESTMLLIRGPQAVEFWGFEVFLGILLPALILVKKGTIPRVAVSSLLVMIGIFVARYDFVIGGQLIPVAGPADPVTYGPSITETLIVVGAFAFCILLYLWGVQVLRLSEHGLEQERSLEKDDTRPPPLP